MITPRSLLARTQVIWSWKRARLTTAMTVVAVVLSGFALPEVSYYQKAAGAESGASESGASEGKVPEAGGDAIKKSILEISLSGVGSEGDKGLLARLPHLGDLYMERPSGAMDTVTVPTSPVVTTPPPAIARPPVRSERLEVVNDVAEEVAEMVSETETVDIVGLDELPEPEGPGEYLGSFSVTCYALDGNTASGEPVHEGGVAVDRRVIPFGTRIYIENVGWRVANDTGSSVRGNRLDIWLPSYDACIGFGRQTLDVFG